MSDNNPVILRIDKERVLWKAFESFYEASKWFKSYVGDLSFGCTIDEKNQIIKVNNYGVGLHPVYKWNVNVFKNEQEAKKFYNEKCQEEENEKLLDALWDFDYFKNDHLKIDMYYAENCFSGEVLEIGRTLASVKKKLLFNANENIDTLEAYEDIAINRGYQNRVDIQIKDELTNLIDTLINNRFYEKTSGYIDKLHNRKQLEKHINDFCQYFKGIYYMDFNETIEYLDISKK